MNKSAVLAKKFPTSTGIICEGDVIVKWEVPEHPIIPTDAEIELWAQEIDYIEITATQFLRALTQAGIRSQIDAYVEASTDQDLKDLYSRSQTFRSNNPVLLTAANALGISEQQVMEVFQYGQQLNGY